MQCRKFLGEQYAQTGLRLHPQCVPVEVKQQPDGRLTVVIKHADGKVEEIADNDQVLMATGEELCRAWLHWSGARVSAEVGLSRSWGCIKWEASARLVGSPFSQ